jgi:hypothetical protein
VATKDVNGACKISWISVKSKMLAEGNQTSFCVIPRGFGINVDSQVGRGLRTGLFFWVTCLSTHAYAQIGLLSIVLGAPCIGKLLWSGHVFLQALLIRILFASFFSFLLSVHSSYSFMSFAFSIYSFNTVLISSFFHLFVFSFFPFSCICL